MRAPEGQAAGSRVLADREGRAGPRHAGRRRRTRRSWTVGASAGALALAGGIAALLAGGGAFDAFGGSPVGDVALGGGNDAVVRRGPEQALPGEAGADAARVARSGAPAPTGASTSSRAAGSGPDGTAAPGKTAQAGKATPSGSARAPGQVPPSAGARAPGDDTSSGKVAGTSPDLVAPTTGGYVEPDESYDRSGYRASGPSSHTDRQAVRYFRAHWGPGDKAASHVTDIRTVGRYLRIYTNLPGSAYNSRHAITLCKRGLQYLKQTGESRRIVFVQARFGENGNPVLANILGPSDANCRVSAPDPH